MEKICRLRLKAIAAISAQKLALSRHALETLMSVNDKIRDASGRQAAARQQLDYARSSAEAKTARARLDEIDAEITRLTAERIEAQDAQQRASDEFQCAAALTAACRNFAAKVTAYA